MSSNLGKVSLRARRRTVDPMQAYDALPTPLRHWLSQAALPWSPSSARKIWQRAQSAGLTGDDALSALYRAEAHTLARERHSLGRSSHAAK